MVTHHLVRDADLALVRTCTNDGISITSLVAMVTLQLRESETFKQGFSINLFFKEMLSVQKL